jgi:vesicle transport protein SEC22
MPIESLWISRVTDGLVLVLSNENSAPNAGSGGAAAVEQMDVFKNQAKQLLKKIHPRSTARMSIDSNPFIFHYIIEQGICYLALTEKGYPKRLAFLFLEEIHKEFTDYLKLEYGDDSWQRTVETIGRQYAFIKFDRAIQKKRREFSDPNSAINMRKLNDDLQSIQNVMRKTIDDVLERGNKLDNGKDPERECPPPRARLSPFPSPFSLFPSPPSPQPPPHQSLRYQRTSPLRARNTSGNPAS